MATILKNHNHRNGDKKFRPINLLTKKKTRGAGSVPPSLNVKKIMGYHLTGTRGTKIYEWANVIGQTNVYHGVRVTFECGEHTFECAIKAVEQNHDPIELLSFDEVESYFPLDQPLKIVPWCETVVRIPGPGFVVILSIGRYIRGKLCGWYHRMKDGAIIGHDGVIISDCANQPCNAKSKSVQSMGRHQTVRFEPLPEEIGKPELSDGQEGDSSRGEQAETSALESWFYMDGHLHPRRFYSTLFTPRPGEEGQKFLGIEDDHIMQFELMLFHHHGLFQCDSSGYVQKKIPNGDE
jgi:hypothetical protein